MATTTTSLRQVRFPAPAPVIPLWDRVFERTAHSRELWRVAPRWPGTLCALAGALGCDHATAAQVGRCRAPEPAEIPLWVEYIAARVGLDPARVAAVAQQIAW